MVLLEADEGFAHQVLNKKRKIIKAIHKDAVIFTGVDLSASRRQQNP